MLIFKVEEYDKMSQQMIDLLNKKIRANYHSIREAATLMDVSQSQLSQILKGKGGISSSNAIKMAEYLNLSVEEALNMAGHSDLIPLLNDLPPPKLKEDKLIYAVREDNTDQSREMQRLYNQLPPRDKFILLKQLRAYVNAIAEYKQTEKL